MDSASPRDALNLSHTTLEGFQPSANILVPRGDPQRVSQGQFSTVEFTPQLHDVCEMSKCMDTFRIADHRCAGLGQ